MMVAYRCPVCGIEVRAAPKAELSHLCKHKHNRRVKFTVEEPKGSNDTDR